eukprot:TRINITY_DN12918_c0_g3_i1.p2 TRINITY_DN12918_c0_g3~~TRINITY_DN12918_c0_g3_i1.p2  ORF type:complete len:122 (+),score=18.51 TRINITY_DN12918_c0_g3_i1:204-569(+)
MESDKLLAHNFRETFKEYDEREVALYALAVGAPGANPCDPVELPLVYNSPFDDAFKALPTFAVLFPHHIIGQVMEVEGVSFDPALLLHAEQSVELMRSLPTKATVRGDEVTRLYSDACLRG